MKIMDFRFHKKTINLLCNTIGKTLINLKCDPFLFSNSVYGIVGVKVQDSYFAFTNFVEVLDYYGGNEDVAVFKLNTVDENEVHSYTGEEMISIPINSEIVNIEIVNENQRLYKDSNQIYDVWITRGIIFKLKNGKEISLEKDVWFSEDINIERGKQLIDKFAPTSDFVENWENEYRGECIREVIEIS